MPTFWLCCSLSYRWCSLGMFLVYRLLHQSTFECSSFYWSELEEYSIMWVSFLLVSLVRLHHPNLQHPIHAVWLSFFQCVEPISLVTRTRCSHCSRRLLCPPPSHQLLHRTHVNRSSYQSSSSISLTSSSISAGWVCSSGCLPWEIFQPKSSFWSHPSFQAALCQGSLCFDHTPLLRFYSHWTYVLSQHLHTWLLSGENLENWFALISARES